MQYPKPPSNQTDQELLDLLNTGKQDLEEPEILDDVINFCAHYGIDAGEKLVNKSALYRLYKMWSLAPMTRHEFGLRVSLFLLSHQIGGRTFYKINHNIFKIQRETEKAILRRERDPTKIRSFKRHFESYLKRYDIKQGHCWLESFVLYYLYDKWAYSIKKKRPLGRKQFIKMCQLYFYQRQRRDMGTTNRISWFGVDHRILKHLPHEHLLQLREGRVKFHGRKKKGKSKKESEIPSVEPSVQPETSS